MKALATILLVLGVFFVGWKTWVYWEEVKEQREGEEAPKPILDSRAFKGMPSELEPELRESRKDGAEGLKRFLDRWSTVIKDPRLGALELDYIVAISATDPIEAKRRFKEVQARIPADSPLYPRIQALENTYR